MHGVLVLFEGINSCTVLPNSRSKDKSAAARHLNVNQVPLYKMISHISLCKQSKEHGYKDFCASIFMCFSRFFYKLKKKIHSSIPSCRKLVSAACEIILHGAYN